MNILKRKINSVKLSIKLYESLERKTREELNREQEKLSAANNEVDSAEQSYEIAIVYSENYVKNQSLCPQILGNLYSNTEKMFTEFQQIQKNKEKIEASYQRAKDCFLKNKARLNLSSKELGNLQLQLEDELSKFHDRSMNDLHNIRMEVCK